MNGNLFFLRHFYLRNKHSQLRDPDLRTRTRKPEENKFSQGKTMLPASIVERPHLSEEKPYGECGSLKKPCGSFVEIDASVVVKLPVSPPDLGIPR